MTQADSPLDSGALKVAVERQDERDTVVTVAGEVDAASVQSLRDRIDTLSAVYLVLDHTQVRFMDSSGLAALVAVRRRLQSLGGSVAVVCGEGVVLRVLKLTGLDKVLAVFPTREEALAGELTG
jgi:anti-anti-sigma factor